MFDGLQNSTVKFAIKVMTKRKKHEMKLVPTATMLSKNEKTKYH